MVLNYSDELDLCYPQDSFLALCNHLGRDEKSVRDELGYYLITPQMCADFKAMISPGIYEPATLARDLGITLMKCITYIYACGLEYNGKEVCV